MPVAPEPVVRPPWGNGWGAGRITWYVEIDDRQPGFFGLYRFNAGSNLLAPVYVGPPLTADAVQDTNQVQFTLDLDALKTPAGGTPTDLNLNFIATDRIPLDPNDRTPKLVDALGDFGRGFVTLNSLGSRIYRNADSSSPEVAGDVADPDLDLVDWQVEVRNSSR